MVGTRGGKDDPIPDRDSAPLDDPTPDDRPGDRTDEGAAANGEELVGGERKSEAAALLLLLVDVGCSLGLGAVGRDRAGGAEGAKGVLKLPPKLLPVGVGAKVAPPPV